MKKIKGKQVMIFLGVAIAAIALYYFIRKKKGAETVAGGSSQQAGGSLNGVLGGGTPVAPVLPANGTLPAVAPVNQVAPVISVAPTLPAVNTPVVAPVTPTVVTPVPTKSNPIPSGVVTPVGTAPLTGTFPVTKLGASSGLTAATLDKSIGVLSPAVLPNNLSGLLKF